MVPKLMIEPKSAIVVQRDNEKNMCDEWMLFRINIFEHRANISAQAYLKPSKNARKRPKLFEN
jgi:hypothetical protein